MKKLIFLSAFAVATLSLTSFTNKNEKPIRISQWVVTCADGSYGGSFVCDCNQSQANAIAAIMCK